MNEENDLIIQFEDHKIRRVWDKETEQWYVAVIAGQPFKSLARTWLISECQICLNISFVRHEINPEVDADKCYVMHDKLQMQQHVPIEGC